MFSKAQPSVTDQDLQALRERNLERARAARAKLGKRWTCHPSNSPQKTKPEGVLTPPQGSILGA